MESTNRLLSLHILNILNAHASESTKISQEDILYYLEHDYGEIITRQTLSAYIKDLRKEELILGKRGIYKADLFTQEELRTLIDSVTAGKMFAKRDGDAVIEKLKNLSAYTLQNKNKSVQYLPSCASRGREKLHELMDTIDEAIVRNFSLQIVIDALCAPHGKAEVKTVDPYYVISCDDAFYLLCGQESGNGKTLGFISLSAIEQATVAPRIRTAIEDLSSQDFELDRFVCEHPHMTSGKMVSVEFAVNHEVMDSFRQWFGSDFKILRNDANVCYVSVKTTLESAYSWTISHGIACEVLSPGELRTKIKEDLQAILLKY